MYAGTRTRRFAGVALAACGVWLGAAGAAPAATNNIFTVAGNGLAGFTGDGGPATAARIGSPYGVSATPDGGFLIADGPHERVRRVAPNGVITSIAGTGVAGFTGDGGPAVAARLNTPVRAVMKADGSIVIADFGNHRIREVSPSGTMSTIAGTGAAGFSGDNGPATSAQLSGPTGVAVAADGSVLIADRNNRRVRRVSPSGTITTIAGTGAAGYSGDGGPATSAELDNPIAVATAPDGAILIADFGSHVVRRVAPDGAIATVAGDGTSGDSGDGGPGTAARLRSPTGVSVAPDGSTLIADVLSSRVRRVSPAGTISTFAGTGALGYTGDGAPATASMLDGPFDVAATADGGVLITDRNNRRIRWVDSDLHAPAAVAPPTGGSPAPAAPVAEPARPKLAIALGFTRMSTRAGRRLTIRFAATVPASVTLKLRRNGKTVKTLVRAAHDGRNSIRLKTPKRSGRYTLALKAVGADGQVATDRARVTLK